MLYDANGRLLPDTRTVRPPRPGISVRTESGDAYSTDESRALTPAKVDEILAAANTGDIERQAKLAVEIEEKSWDIAQAVQTRRLAVAGLPWSIEPQEGDDDTTAAEIAEAAEAMLRAVPWDATGELDTFDEALRYGLQGALLPGFAVGELVWSRGGAELLGFAEIEQRHFRYHDETGRLLNRPRLVTSTDPRGIDLPAGKFVVHHHRARPGARCRGGLIRPLAWLHCFSRVNLTDLLTFIERYGMPFLMLRVSPDAWQTERTKLAALVQNFGPAGGAVLTENVQSELLQASNSTGDVYFRLLEYVEKAVTKVVLGQLASSSEATGLSGGDAQSDVRQDLLEADCRALEATVRAQILTPWVTWNYGPDAPVPRLHLQSEPDEDIKATAETAAALATAGLEWDEKEASERTGMTLRRRAPAPAMPVGGFAAPAVPARAEAAPAAAQAEEDAAALNADEDAAALSAEGQAEGAEDAAGAALAEFLGGQGLRQWLGPLQAAIEAAVGEPDPEAFRRKVLALSDDLPGMMRSMDTRGLEALLEGTIYRAAAEGKAAEAARLAAKEGQRA